MTHGINKAFKHSTILHKIYFVQHIYELHLSIESVIWIETVLWMSPQMLSKAT